MSKVVGLTGSREGMTWEQRSAVGELLVRWRATEARHGDCIGADEEFDRIAQSQELDIVVHPPSDPKLRAFCSGPKTRVLEPEPYLKRNRWIVEESDVVIATPKEMVEPKPGRGQGTWSCARFARTRGKLVIVWPDGQVYA